MPRHQRSIIIVDVESLAANLAIVICGFPGAGAVHIVVSDVIDAISWMGRKIGAESLSS